MKLYIIVGFRKWNPSAEPETISVSAFQPGPANMKFNFLKEVKTAAWFDHIFKGIVDTETGEIEEGDF